MRGIFITGTDTDVGKTFVTAAISRQLREEGTRVGVYKPACSGAEADEDGNRRWADVETHFLALGGDFERKRICPQCFEAPAAPPVAARLESRMIDGELLTSGHDWWRDHVDLLLVEGVGGWLCPLTESSSVADFAEECGWPIIIVASRVLGTLNHTLLTIESIRRRNLTIAGIILNQNLPPSDSIAERTNPEELAKLTDLPILSLVDFETSKSLRHVDSQATIDWREIAALNG